MSTAENREVISQYGLQIDKVDFNAVDALNYWVGSKNVIEIHNRYANTNTGVATGKEELKWVLFTDNMLVYLGNHIKYTQQLLNLISKFSKITGYNVNIQKSTERLHTSNKCLAKIMCLL